MEITLDCEHNCEFKCCVLTSNNTKCYFLCDYVFSECKHQCSLICHKSNVYIPRNYS
jgi:hypothetical protein